MYIVNLTPHDVNVLLEDGVILTFPPTIPAARVKTNNVLIGMVGEIPIYQVVYEDVENLPEPMEDTVFIVSAIVATAVKDRMDVFAPDTGASAIRGEGGKGSKIDAVRGFLHY